MKLTRLVVFLIFSIAVSISCAQDGEMERRTFAAKLAEIKPGDNKQKVESLLGSASKVLDMKGVRLDQRPDAVQNSGAVEVWYYSTNDRSDFPTLGQLHFDSKGNTITTFGGAGAPINCDRISENELRDLLRLINQMPPATGRDWNPAVVIDVANAIVSLGKHDGHDVIREYIRISPETRIVYEQAALLLVVLHEVPDKAVGGPPLLLGSTFLNEPDDPSLIPRYPIHLLRYDIPVFLVFGYTYTGSPGSGLDVLDWYEVHGNWRNSKIEVPENLSEEIPALKKEVLDLLKIYHTSDMAAQIAKTVFSQLDRLLDRHTNSGNPFKNTP